VTAQLDELPAAVQKADLKAPSVVIIGSVVSLRTELVWFEARPLLGKRILVTRPRHQALELSARLEEMGAEVSLLPAVEIREPADWTPVDRALANLSAYQWLVFTSANGVDSLISRLRQLGRDLRALGSLRLAVIGPATADALRRYHLEPDLIPAVFDSEDLAAALRNRVAGQRVLLARADRGRELLREQLSQVAKVEQIAVYSQVDAIEPGCEALKALKRGEIDYVTLTSSNIARSLIHALDAETLQRIRSGTVQLVSISPVTSTAIRELRLPVAVEAREFTAEGVARALLRASEPRP
jgi:uroporphyrinogen III methyltransferase/synthase